MTYTGLARSNYFMVKSAKDFEGFCSMFGGMELQFRDREVHARDGRRYDEVGVFIEDGCIPGQTEFDADGNQLPKELDFITELPKYLAPETVAIFHEVGNEGMRYLNGYSIAVNSKGKMISIYLNDVFEKAKKRLTNHPEEVTPVEY
jgi:hypothetical protein